MSSPLIVSVSGIRGIIGDSLTPESALAYTRAFAAAIKGDRVIVGSDSRPSREWLVPLVISALVASGKQVFHLGICPTPTVGLSIRRLKAAGGICITASHNPIIYNGLKFFHSGGEFFTNEDNARMIDIFKRQAWLNPAVDGIGSVTEEPKWLEWHIEKVMKTLGAAAMGAGSAKSGAKNSKGAKGVKSGRGAALPKKLRVVVDCCNGAGCVIAPELLRRLGCEVIPIFNDPTKPFPREPEPLPEHLGALCRAVRKHKADLGFAMDPDADRLGVVDEKGRPIGEERTLVLAADAFFSMAKGAAKNSPYVVNLSCSLANDEVARRHGVEIIRTPIGEANVVAGMHEHGAQMGGEGNGGVIFPAVHAGRDAATAIAWILIALRRAGMPLSELNQTIPNYVMIRRKQPLGAMPLKTALSKAGHAFAGAAEMNRQDGIKFIWADRWFHIRPSNTEPIIRMTAEAPTAADAQALMDRAVKAMQD